MSEHDGKDNIVCAHCDHEHEEWWEFYLDEECEEKITCHLCNKEFEVTKQVSYSFDSRKIPCEECDLGEEYVDHTVEQDACDRWNAEKFLDRDNHKPYTIYRRDCNNCDEYESRSPERA
jgi:hypothetical protein